MTETGDAGVQGRSWRAPAKINLALHVTGRRADGYHEIESLAVFTRFGDFVTITEAETDAFSVDGPFAAGVPLGGDNLAIKARDALRHLLRHLTSGDATPIDIRLTKNLPVSSGIGGGSADAAAVLTALNQRWSANVAPGRLAELGQIIGADVPMCLHSRPLVAKGIGETIELVANAPALALVLVNPGVALSTVDVFKGLARRDNAGLPPLPRVIEFHSLRNWLDTTRNDLEPAARTLQPVIGRVLAALNKADAGFSRMSGSGATCFGLFETGNVAKRAAIEIRRRNPDWFVAATRTMTSETDPYGRD